MKKILIFTQKVDREDSILGFFHRWIEEFARQYEKVTVVCLYKGMYSLPQNVEVISLGKEEGVSRFTYLMRFYSTIFGKRGEYDEVFVHMNQIYVILGGLVWRVLSKKIGLWYAHGYVPFGLRVAEKLAHIIFTSTKSGFRIESKKTHVVGQGIDTDFFAPTRFESMEKNRENSEKSIITVGRISPVKNLETLIDAVKILSDQGIRLPARIIGSAETADQKAYLQILQKKVQESGVTDLITFVGAVSNFQLPEHLSNATFFVNTGLTGSLDKTGLEAMAMGLPILTCNEAYEEVLGEQAEQYMFPKKDAAALASKLAHLNNRRDDEIRESGKQMRDIIVNNHGLSRLVTTIKQIYERSI